MSLQSEAMQNNPLLHHVMASNGDMYQAVSPIPTEAMAAIPLSNDTDVKNAVGHARTVFETWSRTSMDEREKIMRKLQKLILRQRHELLDIIQRETGKSRSHALEELVHVVMTARYLQMNGADVIKTRSREGAIPLQTSTYVNHMPVGVVGVIAPWNYPFSLAMIDALAAIFAGNTVVLKPDVQTTWSALHAVRLLELAGLPAGVITIVTGDGPTVGGALVEQADYVCFTGSTETGRKVAQQVGERLVNASLELGGKNPMIVRADADLQRFLDIALSSCFTSAGQLCVSTERIYIDASIYETFKSEFVARVKEIKLGSYLGWGYDMGSITTKQQLERIQDAVRLAKSEGAIVECGGRTRPDIGPLVYEPTVLTHVTPAMEISRKEVFGPVVYLASFKDDEDAIRLCNESGYGLSASIISADTKAAVDIAAEINCGSVNINEGFAATFGSVAAPMGGMGQSGSGRRQGPEGILRFTEAQTVSVQKGAPVSRKFGQDDKKWGKQMTRKVRILRGSRLR
jgi:succinate-semialdehyde dehydrogenase/glutarate-semialdehyde dehydrogenase